MGKYDKDRHQKEMALRYCLAQGMSPYLEVVISSASDLSDTAENLTDIDVLGLEFVADGGLRRMMFDCKSTNKMSAVNRAFWAAGLSRYAGCDDAFVILKNRAVYNHRLSSLSIGVDLHDEISFASLGESREIGFNRDIYYQSSLDRWNSVFDVYSQNTWLQQIFSTCRNLAPLSTQPAKTFRRIIAELRSARGQFDPAKDSHLGIMLDVMSSVFVLWTSMGRDMRRFYDPKMNAQDFEKALRYYVWGGREAYQIRSEIRQRNGEAPASNDLPAWDKLLRFSGVVLAGPNDLFGCINICRDLSIRYVTGVMADQDKRLSQAVAQNLRARQFILGATEYVVRRVDCQRISMRGCKRT